MRSQKAFYQNFLEPNLKNVPFIQTAKAIVSNDNLESGAPRGQLSARTAQLDLTVEVYNLYAVLSVLLVAILRRRGLQSAHHAQLTPIPLF